MAETTATLSDWATALAISVCAFCAMIVLVVYIIKTGRFPWEDEK